MHTILDRAVFHVIICVKVTTCVKSYAIDDITILALTHNIVLVVDPTVNSDML